MATPERTSGDPAAPFEPDGVEFRSVSPRLVTARLVSGGITVLLPVVAGAVLALAFSPWWWVLAGVPAAIFLATAVVVPRQVRALGYAERDDDLLVRKGVLFRSLVVVPYGRMQYVDVEAEHGVGVPAPHEVLLERQAAGRGVDERRDAVVGDGPHPRPDAEGHRELRRHLARRGARAQPRGADHVRGEVLVAQREPGVLAEAGHLLERRVRLAAQAPAALLVVQAGERVQHRVDVRGDVQAVQLGVVADVHDDVEGVRGQRSRHAVGQAGAADAAGEQGHARGRGGGVGHAVEPRRRCWAPGRGRRHGP